MLTTVNVNVLHGTKRIVLPFQPAAYENDPKIGTYACLPMLVYDLHRLAVRSGNSVLRDQHSGGVAPRRPKVLQQTGMGGNVLRSRRRAGMGRP